MKEKSRTRSGFMRFSLSSLMVVMQVGLSMVLLTGAGLFARSLVKLQNEDVGFDRSNMLLRRYRSASRRIQTHGTRNALPAGNRSPGFASASPIRVDGDLRADERHAAGAAVSRSPDTRLSPAKTLSVEDILTGPKYAETLGVPLLRGREIEIRDTPRQHRESPSLTQLSPSATSKIKIRLAARLLSTTRLTTALALEIVGVVGDIKSDDAREKARAGGLSSDSSDPGPGCLLRHYSRAHARGSDAAHAARCGR